jgi:hypothetical protein
MPGGDGRVDVAEIGVRGCPGTGVGLPHRVNIDVFTAVGNCVRISERVSDQQRS